MNNGKTKVLYIIGAGRSGSTILHSILGQIDNIFAGGQLRCIWNVGFSKNQLCDCGVQFQKCETWAAMIREGFGDINNVDADKMTQLTEAFRIHRLLGKLILPKKQNQEPQLAHYLENSEKIYRAIQATTNCRVVVDSSQYPAYGYLLRMMPGIDLYVVHFIRDSRGVAYSFLKNKLSQTGGQMDRYSIYKSSLYWNTRNITAGLLQRHIPKKYMMLRYEDFVNNPQKSLKRILNLLGETDLMLPSVEDNAVLVKVHHSLYGNPYGSKAGMVKLRLDDEWKIKMKKSQKIAVTALTYPLLLKYRYSMKY